MGATVALATAMLVGVFASSALATRSRSDACDDCHDGPTLGVTTVALSVNATGRTYSASSAGASALAVFDGSTKIGATINGSSGQVTVPFGKTYTIYAVKGSPGGGIGQKSLTPKAPATDTTAPSTVSDAEVSYTGTAVTINLTAKDDTGGSGVAATYHILDGGTQSAGTTAPISGAGAHTLEFWSVDVAGNTETPHNTIDITLGAAASSTTISTPPATVPYGAETALTGVLASGAGLAGRTVVVQTSSDNVAWTAAAVTGITDGSGAFSVAVRPYTKAYYRVRFAGEAAYAPSASGSVLLTPKAYLSTPSGPKSIVRNRRFTSVGYLKPRHSAGGYPVKLQAFRYQSGKWVLRKTFSAKASNYSTYTKYSASVYLPYAGKWKIRANHAACSKNAATLSYYRYVTAK